MAKRFNISLPDEMAKRLESIKSQISLSELMQHALEKELSLLIRSDEDKVRSESLTRAVKDFWRQDRQLLYRGAELFVEYYLEKAVQDQDYLIFKLHCRLENESVDEILSKEQFDEYDEECVDADKPMTMIAHFFEKYEGPHRDDVNSWGAGYVGSIEDIRDEYPREKEFDHPEMLMAVKDVLADKLKYYLKEDIIKKYLK